jgi:hypothetical protein
MIVWAMGDLMEVVDAALTWLSPTIVAHLSIRDARNTMGIRGTQE